MNSQEPQSVPWEKEFAGIHDLFSEDRMLVMVTVRRLIDEALAQERQALVEGLTAYLKKLVWSDDDIRCLLEHLKK